MTVSLSKSEITSDKEIIITGSKSETNRLLLLQALYPSISVDNKSNSDDSVLMEKALTQSSNEIDIHHAGTAMRFLTAYFSIQEGRTITITGSKRMKERPIEILVDALQQLGATITYKENKGYPPLEISGKTITKQEVTMNAGVSSQYISALLLIGSQLKSGLKLTLEGKITSLPYIKMTLALLNDFGIETAFNNQIIEVKPQKTPILNTNAVVESDWSSASYFYSIIALSPIGSSVKLSAYKASSLQGDSVLAELYKSFGVSTTFNKTTITLTKDSNNLKPINFDLSNAPDIAQTIAVTALGLELDCHLTGLHTLKIKETDRLVALQNEIEKFGAKVTITDSELTLQPTSVFNKKVSVATYNDHRMAMAFAPLALKTGFNIENGEVVSKSYPSFWKDLEILGFSFSSN